MLVLALAGASPPAGAAETTAFVLTSDFQTGSLSAADLDTRAVSLDLSPYVCPDARVRWFDGLLYVVNRLGCDNILVLDPTNGYSVVRQFSVGNGANPADIALISRTKAYVSRYGEASLMVVNPTTGAGLGQISLAAFADADGIPEMDRMIRVGNRVFVSLQRLDENAGFQPTDYSLVAVIDASADTVIDADPLLPGVQAITLAAKNPVTTFAFDSATDRLLIGCVGQFGVLDGAIEWLDPEGMTSLGPAISEAALGGDIGDLSWNGPEHSYAIISDSDFNSSLVSWSAITGTKLATLFSPGGFSLPECELNDRGELYLCDNRFDAPGLYVFSTFDDQMLAGPIDTGLPPNQLTFDASADVVAGVAPVPAPQAVALSPPRPNPARGPVRLRLALERRAMVRVEVLDAAGRRVRELTAGPAAAGEAEISWDLRDRRGRRVEPGLYWICASVDTNIVVRRLVVLY